MTAYARAARETDWGHAIWELRGVNNRYLDAVFRMPEELRFMEAGFRERLTRRINRGKLECSLKLDLATSVGGMLEVDHALAKQLADAGASLASVLDDAEPLRTADVLRWPGVVRSASSDMQALEEPIQELLEQALEDLVEIVARVRERRPQLIELARSRLRERLTEVMESLDNDRVEQEMVILANKQDVAEELDRLDAHVAEVRQVLGGSKPMGRRLDFLMQELNREANTLGSKSGDADTTRASVDLKVLIEQMREQIQNLE